MKIRKDLDETSKVERRRGTERSIIPTRRIDPYKKDDIRKEKSSSKDRSKYDSKYERRKDSTLPEEKTRKKSYTDDVKKKTDNTSKRQRSFWDKITDWNKKSKSKSSVSKPKSKSEDRKASKPRKASPSKKSKSTSKSSPPKKSTSSKGRRKK